MEPLDVPGTMDSLGDIRRYVMDAAEEAGLAKKAAYRLRLAVDEIAANIVEHGYEEAGITGEIRVRGELDDDSLTIDLEDSAPPFDPRTRQGFEQSTLELSAEDRPIGGLGIFLALEGVDRFEYLRLGDRNRSRFIMSRSLPEPPEKG